MGAVCKARTWSQMTQYRIRRLMGSLVAALLQRVGMELQSRLYSPEDEAIVHEELPEPMLEVCSGFRVRIHVCLC